MMLSLLFTKLSQGIINKMKNITAQMSLTKTLLIFGFVASTGIIIYTLKEFDSIGTSSWAIITSCLAVITAIISAWEAHNVILLQKRTCEPNPQLFIDAESRYGLILIGLKNLGGSPAYNINIYWKKTPIDTKGNKITFKDSFGNPEIQALSAGELVKKTLGEEQKIFSSNSKLLYSFEIHFNDSIGKSYTRKGLLDVEKYHQTISYSEEHTKTNFELQRIPQEIAKLTKCIKENFRK